MGNAPRKSFFHGVSRVNGRSLFPCGLAAALGHPTAEFGGDLHDAAPSQREKNTKIPSPEPAELRGGSCIQQELPSPIKNPNISIVANESNPKIKTSTTHPQPPPQPPALPLGRMNLPLQGLRDAGSSQPTQSSPRCAGMGWGNHPKFITAGQPLGGALCWQVKKRVVN